MSTAYTNVFINKITSSQFEEPFWTKFNFLLFGKVYNTSLINVIDSVQSATFLWTVWTSFTYCIIISKSPYSLNSSTRLKQWKSAAFWIYIISRRTHHLSIIREIILNNTKLWLSNTAISQLDERTSPFKSKL